MFMNPLHTGSHLLIKDKIIEGMMSPFEEDLSMVIEDILTQLYLREDLREELDNERIPRTESSCEVVKLPPNCS